MKRSLVVAMIAVAVVAFASAPVLAKHRTHRTAASAMSAAQTCDPSHCTGSCPIKGGASAAASPKASTAGGQACPVSDPSKCPPGCPRPAADAVAAQVTQR
jgi:hypothetical protein